MTDETTFFDVLHEADAYLAPLFGLEPGRLRFAEIPEWLEELAGPCPEAEAAKEFMVSFEIYKDNGFDHSWSLDLPLRNFEIGFFVSGQLYELANPDEHNKRLVFHNKDYANLRNSATGPDVDANSKLLDNCTNLRHLVSNCGAIAYEKHLGEIVLPLQYERKVALKSMFELDGKEISSYDVAKMLIGKEGTGVIKNLVPMDFDQARDYCLKEVGFDLSRIPSQYIPLAASLSL